MRKRMVSAFLAIAMVAGLVGCGSTASSETGSAAGSEPVAEETKTSSTGDEIVLEFPSWQATEPGFQEFWEEAVAEFENRHENVRINLYQVPFDSYVDTLTTLYAAENAPQITHIPSRYAA